MRPLVHHVPSFADRSYLTLALSRKAAARHERTLEGVGCTLREARGPNHAKIPFTLVRN